MRARYLGGIALALLALTPAAGHSTVKRQHPVVQAPTPLPLKVIATAKRNAARLKSDQFATVETTDQFVGQSFTVEIQPSAAYRNGVLELSFSTSTLYPNKEEPVGSEAYFEHHPSIPIAPSSITKRGAYAGQNGFGARATVTVMDLENAELLVPHGYVDTNYTVETSLPAPEAKALAAAARFVFRGKIARTDRGKVAGCTASYSSPTISSPYSGANRTCWVAVVLDEVAAVDRRTGAVLRTWAN